MIVPITATPMVEPIERKKVRPAVTSPSCLYGKAFWTTMVKRLIITPIPRPVTTMLQGNLPVARGGSHAREQEHANCGNGEAKDRQDFVATGARE